MPIAPDMQQLLRDYQQAQFPAYSSLTPQELRQRFNNAFKNKPTPPQTNMYKVEAIGVPSPHGEIRLRAYYPADIKNLPALMYFHGGGFVIRDDMDIYDGTCRLIAKHVGCVVIAVDYRLAPEHPFPAAPEDCYAATVWVANHCQQLGIDQSRLGVWGESCGGNLSTVIAMMIRDRNGPDLVCQVIISPMLDVDFNRDTYQHYAEGYILTRDTMRWFWNHYLSKEVDKKNPYALPVQAENLMHLPPALVVTTEYDVLRDEGEYYSQMLQRANVQTIYCCYEGLIHGFFDLYYKIEKAKMACHDVMRRAKLLLQHK